MPDYYNYFFKGGVAEVRITGEKLAGEDLLVPYIEPSLTITWNAENGEAPDEEKVVPGAPIEKRIPAREGYTFAGWY